MQYTLSVPQWLKLNQETRNKIAEVFQLNKSKGVQIESEGGKSVVVSDGYTHEDLEEITVQKMKDYLGGVTLDDFLSLFSAVVAKIEEDKEMVIEEDKAVVKEIDNEDLKKIWQEALDHMKRQAVDKGLEVELRKMLGSNSKKSSF